MIDLAQARRILQLTLAEYSKVRADYWAQIYDSIYGYVTSGGAVTSYKNAMKRAMVEAFPAVGDIAWQDAGADLPLDDDAASWITSKMNAEIGYIDNTFENMKLLRKETDQNELNQAAIHQAFQRADLYSTTLDSVYSTIKLMGAGSKMLTFTGPDGDESCDDCQRYKNKRHKASWWVANDAIPPNRSFECGGYRCEHILVDDQGQIYTI